MTNKGKSCTVTTLSHLWICWDNETSYSCFRLKAFPTDSRDMIREGLRASAGKVKLIRDTLTKWFDLLMKQPPPGNMPTGVRNHVWKLRSFPYGIMGFADSVVISVPLEDDAVMRANRLFIVLSSIARMMLISLGNGIPLRAGLDVGLGLRGMFPNEVYGACIREFLQVRE